MAGNNGGRRPGAGRKPKPVVERKRNFASAILPDKLEQEKWGEQLNAELTLMSKTGLTVTVPDNTARREALKYLGDHKHGKAPQAVELVGKPGTPPIEVRITHVGLS